MRIKHIWVNLSLFDGAAGAEGGEGATGESGSNPEASAAETQTGEGTESTDKGDADQESREDAYKRFKKEYKDLYAKDFQETFNRRFKDAKNLENRLNEYQPLMDVLSERYNANDVASLIKAIENDNSYWEQAAYDANMSVDQYKEVSRLKRENRALQEAQRQAEYNQKTFEIENGWREEAKALQEQYPDFDFNYEMADERFRSLIASLTSSGFPNPIQTAYETMHMGEIKSSLVQYTAQQTQKAVTDDIRAKGMRPAENAASSQNAFTEKVDVSKLTDREMDEYIKRAARGEVISF